MEKDKENLPQVDKEKLNKLQSHKEKILQGNQLIKK